MSDTIGISPGVGILAIFRYIKYKPWYAMAEYVDNAIDSYLKNRKALEATDADWFYQLKIDIEFNLEDNFIRISDNAAGIRGTDLERALRMAVRPPDRAGLSEFGMGMKAASCWFSPMWSVETQALGEQVKRKVIFDVQRIVENETIELDTNPLPSISGAHFTNIYLGDVYSMPTQHGIAKIREHLSSIYRDFIREDKLFDRVIITVNGKELKYKAPLALIAPPFADKSAEPIKWRKELDFTCAGGQRVTGFAAIYPTARTKEAGFALLRRGRVVEGSFDEPYRPAKIFGAPGSFYSQRIYGELHLDGFTASFTKDGVQWNDTEDDFLGCLKAAMKAPGIDLLKQANGMRVKESTGGEGSSNSGKGDEPPGGTPPSGGTPVGGGEQGGGSTGPGVGGSGNGQQSKGPTPPGGTPPSPGGNDLFGGLSGANPKPNEAGKPAVRVLSAQLNGVNWRVYVELSNNPAHTEWLCISKLCIPPDAQPASNERQLGVRVSMAHPFTQKYEVSNTDKLEPLLKLAAALALGKTVAAEGSVHNSSLFMDYVNELLLKF
jgi:hypothetical protein